MALLARKTAGNMKGIGETARGQRRDDDGVHRPVELIRGDHQARPGLADLLPLGGIEIDQNNIPTPHGL